MTRTPKTHYTNSADSERRRKRAQSRDEKYRQRLEQLRRQIEAARKRRQLLLLLILLLLFSVLMLSQRAISWAAQQRDVDGEGSGGSYDETNAATVKDWNPSPEADYAPRAGEANFCDGYTFQQWTKLADNRGIRVNSRLARKRQWEADPQWLLFPERYQNWGYKPFLGEIMRELRDPRWGPDAFLALKAMAPPEVQQYLDEAYTRDPADIHLCQAEFSEEIIRNIQSAALRWEIRKRREEDDERRNDGQNPGYDMPPDGGKPK